MLSSSIFLKGFLEVILRYYQRIHPTYAALSRRYSRIMIDIDDLRRRFAAATLARADPGEVDEADEFIREPAPPVTLAQIRNCVLQPLTQEESVAKANFGPLSNQLLFNRVFSIEPVFKQFVVSSCNAGIFRNRPSHVNCIKMIQLLCYGRLQLKNALSGQAVARQAAYQAMAMGEALGPFIPDAWKLPEAEAREEIVRAVRWLITVDGVTATGLDGNLWFDAEILGVPADTITAQRVPDVNVALILLEAMACLLPSTNVWLNGVSFVTTAILSLSRRGTVSDELKARVEDGIRDATSAVSVNLGMSTIQRFYKMYCTGVTAANAEELFNHYQALIPDNVITLRNLVLQAAGSGLTTYMVILRAFNDFEDFPWARLMHNAGPEFRNFANAVDLVGGNLYFGFNNQMAAAAAKNFPNLAYASFQLCIKAGGDNPLKRYGGMPRVVPQKALIDQLVIIYVEAHINADENVHVPAPVNDEWRGIWDAARVAYQAMIGGAAPAAADDD
uniref:Uncharacterized protein n=1 Tax=Mos8Chu0 chuvirus TaxID=2847850 RepID=A0A1L4A1T4_9VIRU|nr:hypothetical protein [Mos8Chu0 chuvirus]